MRLSAKIITPLFFIAALCVLSCKAKGSDGSRTEQVDNVTDSTFIKEPKRATLYFVGDAMQHQRQLDIARMIGKGEFDYSECFNLIQPIVEQADYAVVNLEVALGGGKGGYTGYPMFSAPDSYAQALKDAGFDMFLTANNHTLDRLDYGLRRTLDVLDSMKVDHIGTYRNKEERVKKTPFIKDINGISVGFFNYTYGTNGIVARDGAEVNYIDRKDIEREIKATRDSGARFLIVCVHWGDEYHLLENKTQRDLAQFMLDNGVDVIIGGHPHVIQPMHLVDNPATGRKSLVIYSLGNFISYMLKADCQGGASVTCKIEETEDGTIVLKDVSYDTFYVNKPVGGKGNLRVVPSYLEDSISTTQRAAWNRFNSNAEKIFSTHNTQVPRTR